MNIRLSKKVKVKNSLGLHVRPATAIVLLLQKTEAQVTFTLEGQTINPRSVMSILTLAACQNALIEINVAGKNAKETMENLINAFENQFGESANEK